jgi:hypothetical protein
MVGVRASLSMTRSSFGTVEERITVRGLFALLRETLLARPTVAFAVVISSTFASRLRAWISARFSPSRLAECGGVEILCSLCSGEGTSIGAEDGCEQRALILVTLGCLCEGERTSGETGVSGITRASRFAAAAGFGQSSHSGSRSSR